MYIYIFVHLFNSIYTNNTELACANTAQQEQQYMAHFHQKPQS